MLEYEWKIIQGLVTDLSGLCWELKVWLSKPLSALHVLPHSTFCPSRWVLPSLVIDRHSVLITAIVLPLANGPLISRLARQLSTAALPEVSVLCLRKCLQCADIREGARMLVAHLSCYYLIHRLTEHTNSTMHFKGKRQHNMKTGNRGHSLVLPRGKKICLPAPLKLRVFMLS